MNTPLRTTNRRRLLASAWLSFVLLLALLAAWLPLPYAPATTDLAHVAEPPLQTAAAYPHHWLGTDPFGRDLLANLIFGARTALLVSVPAALFSTGLGLMLGSFAGFWGDTNLRVALGYWLASGSALLAAFLSFAGFWSTTAFLLLSGFTLVIVLATPRLRLLRHLAAFPADRLVMSAVALLESIPRLVLVLVMAAVQEASVFNLLLVLSFTYWTGPARLIRADLQRVKHLPYIEAARAAGLSDFSVLLRHALPNASRGVRTAFPLSIAALIGLETTLSFLGIGLPAETASWGRLMATVRLEPAAWWLIAEPGLLLLGTMLALRQLAGTRPTTV
ncbi:ABC transporter permease [Hymenobacter cavernae]|uniref:Peptide ABC transporter permease n=1 Tax=Hymenobacter cavernae TaxID=2044852 RepID=A0ABQ1TLH8_9BACT|nr:ABC transporter permease [Hymenobacter cavernae]GGE96403.1 peptide ABC transporter permease [Hymenobacter cavernae]